MSNNKNINTGLGLAEVLTIVFVVLKLTGVITWSWFWVLSPFWIGLIVFVLIYVGVYLYILYEDRKYTKKDQGKWKF